MVARIWQSITAARMADKYLEYLQRRVVPVFQDATGNVGMFVMKEPLGEFVRFLLLSLWDSEDSLESFARTYSDVMKPGPDEEELLIAFESMARNYKVICKHECSQIVEKI